MRSWPSNRFGAVQGAVIVALLLIPARRPARAQTPGQVTVERYVSAIDDSEQPYSVYVPNGYSPALPHPVAFHMHGYGGRMSTSVSSFQAQRAVDPKEIVYVTNRLRYGGAYWMRITDFTTRETWARVAGSITGNTVAVTATNVRAMTVSLTAGLATNTPLTLSNGVTVNGRSYTGADVGYAFVYPRPDAPSRTMIVFNGYLSSLPRIASWSAFNTGKDFELLPFGWADYVVYDKTVQPSGAVNAGSEFLYLPEAYLEAGFFDADWGLDTNPPRTTLEFDGPPASQAGTYLGGGHVTLQANDNPGGTGVAFTEYRLDGGPWETYAGPFPLDAPGVCMGLRQRGKGTYPLCATTAWPAGDSSQSRSTAAGVPASRSARVTTKTSVTYG